MMGGKNHMKKTMSMLALIALAAFSATVPEDVAKSQKPRDMNPAVSDTEMTTLVRGNTVFALDLYQHVRTGEGNLFYSPYSISAALAMTYAGARGQTEAEMKNTLQFLLPQSRLHPAFDRLEITLASRGQTTPAKDGKGFRLNVVNAIWGQRDFRFQPDFLDILSMNYGAGLRLLDFVRAPENCRKYINDWVSEQTNNKINDLIPRGLIDNSTWLVLTNAIYFNAAWAYQFDKNYTRDGTFHTLNGDPVTVPMMADEAYYSYAKGKNYQAVELPYNGYQLSMVILLPDSGQFGAFENALTYDRLSQVIGSFKRQRVALTMPKFVFLTDFSLKQTLQAMGMPQAFMAQADFSGMTGHPNLKIDDVIHKAFVSVDEAGTEAAAATAVLQGVMAIQPEAALELKIDRPFIFLIRDIPTGTILFVGRVLNPAV
jgi:serpin B